MNNLSRNNFMSFLIAFLTLSITFMIVISTIQEMGGRAALPLAGIYGVLYFGIFFIFIYRELAIMKALTKKGAIPPKYDIKPSRWVLRFCIFLPFAMLFLFLVTTGRYEFSFPWFVTGTLLLPFAYVAFGVLFLLLKRFEQMVVNIEDMHALKKLSTLNAIIIISSAFAAVVPFLLTRP